MNKFLRNNKGQAIVEFSLVLPIMLTLLMGIVGFGQVFNKYIVLSSASRDGARYASLGYSDSEITSMIETSSANSITENITVSITPSELNRTRGESATVLLECDVPINVPILSSIITSPIHLESKTIMRVE